MTAVPPLAYVAEPPARYLARPPLVVDCSVLAGRLFQEQWKQQATEIMAGRSLHAPQLLAIEITSVALKKHKRGMAEIVQDGLEAFMQSDITLHTTAQPQQVLALAVRYQLSAYDACYLWLAAELKFPLATFDQQLATAAREHLASLD